MSKFDLDSFTRALREEHTGDDARSDATLELVVTDLKTRKVSFLSMRRAPLVLLAAAFVFATAFAGATGRLKGVLAAVQRLITGDDRQVELSVPLNKASHTVPAVSAPSARDEGASAPASAALIEEVPPVAPRVDASTVMPPVSMTASVPSIPPSASAVASIARPIDEAALEDALYRDAHRLHFGDQNWSMALTAWNRYLAQVKHGKFGLEARYNRAVCLVRLGRTNEAVRALEPFARGEYGAYRQAEAQALIEKMQGK